MSVIINLFKFFFRINFKLDSLICSFIVNFAFVGITLKVLEARSFYIGVFICFYIFSPDQRFNL